MLLPQPLLVVQSAPLPLHREMIPQALSRVAGNQAEAARLLGLARSNLFRLMKRLGTRSSTSRHFFFLDPF